MTSYGKNIKIQVFGGSHDSEIGVTVTSLPAGIAISQESVQAFMNRRTPGNTPYSSARREADVPLFLSGVDKNLVTDGSVFRAVIKNTDIISSDYENIADTPRPSHADYPACVKYSKNADLRGSGHFSGRLTAPLCIIGAILKDELERRGIVIGAHIESVCHVRDKRFDPVAVSAKDISAPSRKSFPVICDEVGEKMKEAILSAQSERDSLGGVIECALLGLPVGVGEHMFCGMESRISSLVFSVPGVRGIEFGAGFESAVIRGSEHNDPYYTDGVRIMTKTNNCGGILGGMTNGMPLIFRSAVKPTPSIPREQDTVELSEMKNVKMTVRGRHDPCIVPRAVPVIEAAAAIAVFDAMLDSGEWER